MKYECTLDEWLKVGPLLVSSAGVTEVRLTDCTPHKTGDSYSWWDAKYKIITHGPCDLPHDIFLLLDGHKGTGYALLKSTHATYTTAEEAHKDLSRALIEWARNRARTEHADES